MGRLFCRSRSRARFLPDPLQRLPSGFLLAIDSIQKPEAGAFSFFFGWAGMTFPFSLLLISCEYIIAALPSPARFFSRFMPVLSILASTFLRPAVPPPGVSTL